MGRFRPFCAISPFSFVVGVPLSAQLSGVAGAEMSGLDGRDTAAILPGCKKIQIFHFPLRNCVPGTKFPRFLLRYRVVPTVIVIDHFIASMASCRLERRCHTKARLRTLKPAPQYWPRQAERQRSRRGWVSSLPYLAVYCYF